MRRPADPSELGFTQRDRQRLARALRDTDEVRLFRRCQAVLLVAEGRPVAEAAHVNGCRSRVGMLVGCCSPRSIRAPDSGFTCAVPI